MPPILSNISWTRIPSIRSTPKRLVVASHTKKDRLVGFLVQRCHWLATLHRARSETASFRDLRDETTGGRDDTCRIFLLAQRVPTPADRRGSDQAILQARPAPARVRARRFLLSIGTPRIRPTLPSTAMRVMASVVAARRPIEFREPPDTGSTLSGSHRNLAGSPSVQPAPARSVQSDQTNSERLGDGIPPAPHVGESVLADSGSVGGIRWRGEGETCSP